MVLTSGASNAFAIILPIFFCIFHSISRIRFSLNFVRVKCLAWQNFFDCHLWHFVVVEFSAFSISRHPILMELYFSDALQMWNKFAALPHLKSCYKCRAQEREKKSAKCIKIFNPNLWHLTNVCSFTLIAFYRLENCV